MTDTTTEPGLSSDVTEVRAQKLAKLRETVAEVYPAHFHRTMTNEELAEKYADIEPDTLTGDIITVAGRVFSSRNSGMFMTPPARFRSSVTRTRPRNRRVRCCR